MGRTHGRTCKIKLLIGAITIIIYLLETSFNAFANRAYPDQAALLLIRVFSICLWKYDVSGPTLVGLTSNLLVLCTNVKVYLYKYL